MKKVKIRNNQFRIDLEEHEMDFLRKNYRRMTDRELLAGLEKIGCKISFGKLRQVKYERRLIKQKQVDWTTYQTRFLLENYRTMGNVEMAEHFGWPKKKGVKKIWKKMLQMKLKRSTEEIYSCMRNQPNLRHEGEIWWSDCHGAKIIKVNDETHFYARWVWQNQRGDIPEDMCIVHRNGDRRDCRIWNLEMITRSELAKRSVAQATVNLSYNFVAGQLTRGQPELRKILKKEYPQIIEAERQSMLNRRMAKKIQSNETK